MTGLFGTDSVRGVTVAELSCELAMQVGKAVAELFAKEENENIIIAKDGSLSSDVLEAAICAGICSSGVDAMTIGVITGAAASFIVSSHDDAAAGVMISEATGSADASGMIVFDRDGSRISDELQKDIETHIYSNIGQQKKFGRLGRILSSYTAAEEYTSHILSSIDVRPDGLKAAIACGKRCTAATAARLFSELGVWVEMLPENRSSPETDIAPVATELERLMEFAASGDFCCGLAFQGDGGSCIAVDERGMLVDGDTILAIIAKYYKDHEKLKGNTIAVNVMSSLGLMNFAEENGIKLVTSGSCGRSVIDRMTEGGYNLGGGQSGHIFFTDISPCDDGQLCGAKLLEIIKDTGKKLSELAAEMKRLPQISLNVRISDGSREVWKNDEAITGLIDHLEHELGGEGRIIVRENAANAPFIRVMIEGKDFGQINNMAMQIADRIKERCRFYN